MPFPSSVSFRPCCRWTDGTLFPFFPRLKASAQAQCLPGKAEAASQDGAESHCSCPVQERGVADTLEGRLDSPLVRAVTSGLNYVSFRG